MSDINLDITLQQLQTVVTVEQNAINFTPEVVDLRLFAGGFATPAGNTGELQFNNNGVMGATPDIIYDQLADELTVTTNVMIVSNLVATTSNVTGTGIFGNITVTGNTTSGSLSVSGNSNIANMTATGNIAANNISVTNYSNAASMNATSISATTGNITTVNASNVSTSNLTANGDVTLGAIGNITITGGTANYVMTTDGLGNLSWSNVNSTNYAGYAGNVVNASQPNITSLGNLTSLVVTGNVGFVGGANISLGSSSNLEITGGVNGYFLQTDGTGNLTWAASGNVTGNGVPGGANTQIQFNNAGNFGGSAGFTFDTSTNAMATPGDVVASGNISADYLIGITSGPVVNLPYGVENVALISAQSGTYDLDLLNDSIKYTTSDASANVILNFRGNSTVSTNTLLGNGQSITSTYVLKNGSTPYSVSSIEIDGSAQSIKWVSGVSPIAVANTLNAYTFTIVKTATTPTYDVLGSLTRYV